jgi:subtilisin family serine protease
VLSAWGHWRSFGLLGAAALAVLFLPSGGRAEDLGRAARVPGRLVVRARTGLGLDALSSALQRTGARHVRTVEPLAATVIDVPEAELSTVEATLRRSGLFKSVERDYVAHIAEDPNDFYYGAQWGLPRIGAPAAWELSSGAGVVVAVVDTGIDATHPDLQGAVLSGYDFVNGDADPQDDNGHGTHMSGIIAAHRDNGIGIAGIAPDAMLLPVKVLDATGSGAYSNVASGITYAVDNGARVLNLSLTGPVQSSVLQDAIDYATAHDAVVVAAAGNEGSGLPDYPAAANGAVAVAAIDESDAHAAFSNYGSWIAVAAPGVDIVTTSPGNSYASSSGTSPAAAFGSGVFALLFAFDPTLSRSDAIVRVERGSFDLGDPGWDPYFGSGRVDAYGALVPGGTGALPPDAIAPDVTILSPTDNSLVSGMVPVDVAANDNVGVARVELFVDAARFASSSAAPYQFVVDASTLSPGTHKLRAVAYDTSGNVSSTKILKVAFTPGTGLLVSRAIAKPTSVAIQADFALPSGTSYDPRRDRLALVLSAGGSTVLSATAAAGVLALSGTGRAQGTLSTAVPAIGSVRVSAKSSRDQAIYTLKIKASNLNGMQPQTLMNLAVQVGAAQLSQSLSFRSHGPTLMYP